MLGERGEAVNKKPAAACYHPPVHVVSDALRMLRAGLIGFPSTGRTTLFNLLIRAAGAGSSARAGRGEANMGAAEVPDARLDHLTALFEPRRRVAASVVFADIAGGAGARSLVDVAAYREAHTLLHVVRAFRAADVPHAAGAVDAARDARAMEDELILADLAVAERRIERIERDRKKGAGKGLEHEARILDRCRRALENGTPIRALDLDPDADRALRGFQFLSSKPLLLVVNLDEADIGDAERALEQADLGGMLAHPATRAVPVCAKIELEIAQLDADDARAFLADLGLRETGLKRVVRAAYELLGYISFFTVGEDECRAWSIPGGTIAMNAAGAVHTDMQRGFIRAEVTAYEDLVRRGSLGACREHGETRLEGKQYVVRDGDILNFRFAR